MQCLVKSWRQAGSPSTWSVANSQWWRAPVPLPHNPRFWEQPGLALLPVQLSQTFRFPPKPGLTGKEQTVLPLLRSPDGSKKGLHFQRDFQTLYFQESFFCFQLFQQEKQPHILARS